MKKLSCLLIGGLLLAPGVLFAGINLGSGGTISLGQGRIDLAGGDMLVEGALSVGSGRLSGVGDLTLAGSLDGGSGEIQVGGDWTNNGLFNAGTGSVGLNGAVDGTVLVSGESTFATVELVSAAGPVYTIPSGLEQRVTDSLTIRGSAGLPVLIQSDNPPQPAFLRLAQDGAQDITQVGVSNVHAIGQPLAPNETNQGGTGNDLGWFGRGIEALPIPALSAPALALLILTLLGLAVFRLSGQRA